MSSSNPLKTIAKTIGSFLATPLYATSFLFKKSALFTSEVVNTFFDVVKVPEPVKKGINSTSKFFETNYKHYVDEPITKSALYAPKKFAGEIAKFIKKKEDNQPDYDLREMPEQPNHSIHPTSSSPLSPTQQQIR